MGSFGRFSLDDSSDYAESSSVGAAALVGAVSVGYAGTTVSQNAGTEGVESLSTTADGASWATGNPELATAGDALASTFGGIASTSTSIDDGSEIGEIFIFFRKDKTPYSAVEQRAKHIYDTVHKKTAKKSTNFPCIIAKGQDLAQKSSQLLSTNISRADETLEALEKCLEAHLANR